MNTVSEESWGEGERGMNPETDGEREAERGMFSPLSSENGIISHPQGPLFAQYH